MPVRVSRIAKAYQALKLPVPAPPKPPAPPKGLGRVSRQVNAKREPVRSTGKKELQLRSAHKLEPDYCTPPKDYAGLSQHQSAWEFMIYAAIHKKLKTGKNVWQGPFDGGIWFSMQAVLDEGRLAAGGQVCDFLVEAYGFAKKTCFRLQSDHFHTQADNRKRLKDQLDKQDTDEVNMIDLYAEDFAEDCSLHDAVMVVAEGLAGIEHAEPGYTQSTKAVKRKTAVVRK